MSSDQTTNNLSFEDAYSKLEAIVRELDGGQISLDRAIELYEKGMQLSKHCDTVLSAAEVRIRKLQTDLDPESSSLDEIFAGGSATGTKVEGPTSKEEDDDPENLPW